MKYFSLQTYFFLCVLVSVLGYSDSSFAYTAKEGNVTATFSQYFYQTRFHSTPSGAQPPWLNGWGLIALGDIDDKGSLEIGLFSIDKVYMRERAGSFVVSQIKLMHITMGYRRWINDLWSASLTFFSAYPMGDPFLVHSDFPAGQEPTTSAKDLTEYGFDLSVQYDIWKKDRWAIVGDLRYSLSLTNKPREYGDSQGVLIGVRYLIQEGRP